MSSEIHNYRQALTKLGLPRDYPLKQAVHFDAAMARWKELTVAARNANDEEEAKILSQCKTKITKKHRAHTDRICPRCQQAKAAAAMHCMVCRQAVRYATTLGEKSMVPPIFHKVETTLFSIPDSALRSNELTEALKILGKGYIGDSFVTNRRSASVSYLAKTVGGKVICRVTNPNEKDPKKLVLRVWRSDGLLFDEVNLIIKKRIAGEVIEKPPEWVPMMKSEVRKIKKRPAP